MVTSADWYFGLLCVNGTYRCFIMCWKRSESGCLDKIKISVLSRCQTHSNLSLHRNTEESNEVHNKNGPKHRNIENFKECTDESDRRRFRDSVPKLKLGQSSYERSEFFIASGG